MLSFSRSGRGILTPWIALAGAFLGPVLLGESCGHRGETTHSSSHMSIDSEGGGELVVNGVRIEFDATVRYVYRSTASSPGSSQTTTTVNGNEFGLRGETFFIGDREYGTVEPGALVQVTQDGVKVGGEARGPLPESRE